MDAQLLARCERQIDNERALRNMSTLESESSIKVGALLYTAQDLPVSDDKVYASKRILEEKDCFFSSFRGVLQTLILLRMAVSEDPGAFVDTALDAYDRLEKTTGVSGLFTVISSVILMETYKEGSLRAAIDQTAELYGQIKRRHPERTSASELAYVALMYVSGKADVRLEEEKEKIYTALRQKLQCTDDTARATTLVLMTSSSSAEVKVDGFLGFYDRVKEAGHATGQNQYMSIYGAFADLTFLEELGIPESEIITAISETDEYLKKKPGYGRFSINRDMRKVLAAALVLQHYTIAVPQETHAGFHPDTSIELLLFIILMSLAAIG